MTISLTRLYSDTHQYNAGTVQINTPFVGNTLAVELSTKPEYASTKQRIGTLFQFYGNAQKAYDLFSGRDVVRLELPETDKLWFSPTSYLSDNYTLTIDYTDVGTIINGSNSVSIPQQILELPIRVNNLEIFAAALTSDIDTLQSQVTALESNPVISSISWDDVTDKPLTFSPNSHAHGVAEITGLIDALSSKSNVNHVHGLSDVSGLITELGTINTDVSNIEIRLDAVETALAALTPSQPSIDSDALAVITAIEATGVTLSTTQKDAIVNRIVNAKADGVWAKWLAYYGFVGATANSHAINWKNPNQYLINWNGTLIHDANGVKGNGSTGYGDTGLSMQSFTFGDIGLGFYATDTIPNEAKYQIGAGLNNNNRIDLTISNSVGYTDIGTDSSYVGSTANNRSKQYFSGNNLSSVGRTYKNGIRVDYGTLANSVFADRNIYVLATNRSEGLYYSSSRLGSVVLGAGLNDVEEAANYISELAFQTALGRN